MTVTDGVFSQSHDDVVETGAGLLLVGVDLLLGRVLAI